MHPVAERHQRIQALLKFSRNVMKRTGLPMAEREEMIENYCRKHWGLSANCVRDYKKTVLVTMQEEVEVQIEKQLQYLKVLA